LKVFSYLWILRFIVRLLRSLRDNLDVVRDQLEWLVLFSKSLSEDVTTAKIRLKGSARTGFLRLLIGRMITE
jgi:hypothetical protein